VAHDRDTLECWLRQAVMSADDDDALWAWLQSESGRDDLPAWKRLLAHLAFHDPRRSPAAARVRSLRASSQTLGMAAASVCSVSLGSGRDEVHDRW